MAKTAARVSVAPYESSDDYLRLLIGFFEAGFFPGCIYLISMCKLHDLMAHTLHIYYTYTPTIHILTKSQTISDMSYSGASISFSPLL